MDSDEYWSIDFAVDQILPANINQTKKKLKERVKYAIDHKKLSLIAGKHVNRSDFLKWARGKGLNIPVKLHPFIRNWAYSFHETTYAVDPASCSSDGSNEWIEPSTLEQAIALLREKHDLIRQLQLDLQRVRQERDTLQTENAALREIAEQYKKNKEAQRRGAQVATEKKRSRHEQDSQKVDELRNRGYTEQVAVAEITRERELKPNPLCRDPGRALRRLRKKTTR